MQQECGARRTLINCWQECKRVQPLWKSVRHFLRTQKMLNPRTETLAQQAYGCTTNNSKKMESKMLFNRRIDKEMWCVCAQQTTTQLFKRLNYDSHR